MESFATEWTEWAVHTILFWETDNERKGKILRWVHHFMTNALLIMIVVSHTIYPAFWLQTFILVFSIFAWLQHLTCNGCVISKVEQKLIGDSKSFVDPFLELFHIEPTKELSIAFLILGSTIGVGLLSLEWIARVHHKLLPLVSSAISKWNNLHGMISTTNHG
jgi:hypothetical protein